MYSATLLLIYSGISSLALLSYLRADMGTYTKNAVDIPAEHIDLSLKPSISCQIGTRQGDLAGTTDEVFMVFIGAFADSGPHSICNSVIQNTDGCAYEKEVPWTHMELHRQIGQLQSIQFQKNGTDGWILNKIFCKLLGKYYSFEPEERWLDNYSPEVAADNDGNGYEPEQQVQLEAHPSMEVYVSSITQRYTSTGIIKS